MFCTVPSVVVQFHPLRLHGVDIMELNILERDATGCFSISPPRPLEVEVDHCTVFWLAAACGDVKEMERLLYRALDLERLHEDEGAQSEAAQSDSDSESESETEQKNTEWTKSLRKAVSPEPDLRTSNHDSTLEIQSESEQIHVSKFPTVAEFCTTKMHSEGGMTPIHVAAHNGHEAAFALLLGAWPPPPFTSAGSVLDYAGHSVMTVLQMSDRMPDTRRTRMEGLLLNFAAAQVNRSPNACHTFTCSSHVSYACAERHCCRS